MFLSADRCAICCSRNNPASRHGLCRCSETSICCPMYNRTARKVFKTSAPSALSVICLDNQDVMRNADGSRFSNLLPSALFHNTLITSVLSLRDRWSRCFENFFCCIISGLFFCFQQGNGVRLFACLRMWSLKTRCSACFRSQSSLFYIAIQSVLHCNSVCFALQFSLFCIAIQPVLSTRAVVRTPPRFVSFFSSTCRCGRCFVPPVALSPCMR